MKCPKCKEHDLKQSNFKAPFSCTECGGIWILDKEVAKLSESMTMPPDNDLPEVDDVDGRTGLCPSGHGIMIRAKVDIEDPFYLEKCPKCGGIWFDNGEWHRLVESHLLNHLSDFWTQSWQRKQQNEKNREHFLNINRKLLGEETFKTIMDLADSLKNHPQKIHALALLKQEIV